MNDKWKDFSREELVAEYIETRLATIVNFVGTDWRWMPTDVSQDPAYWKAKDQDLHNMHYEVAARYHIKRDDCLWLENIADDINLYLSDKKLKPLIKQAIELLEKKEKEVNKSKGI